MLDPFAFALTLHRIDRLVDDRLDLVRRIVLEDRMPVGCDIGQHAGHRVKPLIYPLCPNPHLGTLVGVIWFKRHCRGYVIKKFADLRGFDHDLAVMDQRRDHRVGIKF